jgi:hypothetical protein
MAKLMALADRMIQVGWGRLAWKGTGRKKLSSFGGIGPMKNMSVFCGKCLYRARVPVKASAREALYFRKLDVREET